MEQREYRANNDYCSQCGSYLTNSRIADEMMENMVSMRAHSPMQIATTIGAVFLAANIFLSTYWGFGMANALSEKFKTKQEIESVLKTTNPFKIYTKPGRELYYLVYGMK